MEFDFLVNRARHRVKLEKLEKKKDSYLASQGGKIFEADVRVVSSHELSLLVEGRSYIIYIAEGNDKKYISLGGETFIVQKPQDEVRRGERGEERLEKGKPIVTAPMPGRVIKVCVAENEVVRKNQTLAIVEAMKMENELKSPVEGVVKKIFVTAGDLVDSEKPLLELEARASS